MTESASPVALRFTLLAALVIAGCTVGPDYERPKMVLPGQYNAEVPQSTPASQ